MSAPAYLPLFGSDYLADTRHLSTEEHGAYLLLMMAAWRQEDCSLPNDDKKLARITGLSPRKWLAIRDTILEFWTVSEGRITQARLLKEWRFAAQKSETNRKSAGARWAKQSVENKETASCERISERNAPQPQPQLEEPNGSPNPPDPHADLMAGDVRGAAPSKARPQRRAAKPETELPTDWAPCLTPAAQAVVEGWPPGMFQRQESAFRNHAADKGRTSKDWQAAFRKWIDNADQWKPKDDRSPNTGRPPAPSREGDGFTRAIRHVRDALAERYPDDPSRVA